VKQPKIPTPAVVTKYEIGPDDLVTVAGHPMTYVKQTDTGVMLRAANDDRRPPRNYKWKEISYLLGQRMLEIEKGYFSERNAIIRAGQVKGFELAPETVLRAKMVSAFIAQEEGIDEAEERLHRSDDDIESFVDLFRHDNAELVDEARASLAAKGGGKLFVGPRQFRRWLERYEKAELDPASMADRREGSNLSRSSFTQEELAFQLVYADATRTNDQVSVKDCFDNMVEANDLREADGLPTYRLPSLTTFQRLVREGNDFLNEAGRSDNKYRIERKFAFKQKGLRVSKPLQIVEMDEHEVDLMLMLTKNGVWDHLHPDVQVRVESLGRVWLSVAMDAYSRSLLGLKILNGSPNAESAVATLAMVAQQKDALSAKAGARSPWPQCGRPEAVHTDAGAGYVSARFELAVMMFTGRHRIPPSKHPHLRARVERFFRTINQRYIHLFSGRTFSNPLMRDEYDSAKYAHLLDEEFADLIVRLIVDCYHNTKHRALGMTPLQAWERGTQLANGAVMPPPTADEYRSIFGITLERSIGNNGIEIFGNIYSSPELLEIRKKWFRAKLVVRLNDQDIHKIAVKHRRLNQWIEVPAVFDGLEGVTLDEWAEIARYIPGRFGKQDEYSQETVRLAKREVKEMIARSKSRPGVILHVPLADRIAEIERKIGKTFAYNQRQPHDYGRYDDGVDHETATDELLQDDAVPPTPTGKSTASPPKPREVRRLGSANPSFKPAGTGYDRSGFMTDEERRKGLEGGGKDALSSRRTDISAAKTKASAPTPEHSELLPRPKAEKPKKTIGFEKRK
jgi:putative transposase